MNFTKMNSKTKLAQQYTQYLSILNLILSLLPVSHELLARLNGSISCMVYFVAKINKPLKGRDLVPPSFWLLMHGDCIHGVTIQDGCEIF